MSRLMIYGANGYTGRLIAREAAKRGLKPLLAGRNRDELDALAKELGLLRRVFELSNPNEVARNLDGGNVVLHCAGPFSRTAAPMLNACLDLNVHYLDITGEIDVFELCPHAHLMPRHWFSHSRLAAARVPVPQRPASRDCAMAAARGLTVNSRPCRWHGKRASSCVMAKHARR